MKKKEIDDRKKPVKIGIIVLVVLLLAGGGFGIFSIIDSVTWVSTDDASIDGNKVNISARILGRVREIVVEEGAKVQAGDVLVLLDDADLRAQEMQAAAQLEYANKNLLLVKVSSARADEDFRRTRSLFNSGATTREQYDHASRALETANAQYAIAQAQVGTAQAQLNVIETQLLNTRLVAPIPGVVARQSFHPGDVVQPGQTIIAVNDLSSVWVAANFEETKIGRISVGAPVQITVDAYSNQSFTGKVSYIGAGINPPPFSIGEFTKVTQRIPVKIQLDAIPEGVVLMPGLSVEVKVRAR